MPERSRVAVLISARGSNMAALIYASRDDDCPYEVALVTGDNPEAPGLDVAEAENVPVVRLAISANDKARYFNDLHALLEKEGVDLIALAGYLVSSLFLHQGGFQRYLWLTLGLAVAASRLSEDDAAKAHGVS